MARQCSTGGGVKGIPSDQIQDTIRRNGLTEGNRKEVDSGDRAGR